MDFYSRIKRCCECSGFTLSELVKSVGISTGMPTKWKNGLIPNGETLVKLADYLDVSIDYLLGREQTTDNQPQVIPYDGLNPKVYEIEKVLESGDVSDEVIDFIWNALKGCKK